MHPTISNSRSKRLQAPNTGGLAVVQTKKSTLGRKKQRNEGRQDHNVYWNMGAVHSGEEKHISRVCRGTHHHLGVSVLMVCGLVSQTPQLKKLAHGSQQVNATLLKRHVGCVISAVLSPPEKQCSMKAPSSF